MILENLNGDAKVFIHDESVILADDEVKFSVYSNTDCSEFYIIKSNDLYFTINLDESSDIITGVSRVKYLTTEDLLYIYIADKLSVIKKIKNDQTISIINNNGTLNFETCKLPMYTMEQEFDGVYPKFDIQISDCVYSMKIYINEMLYIEAPYYQSYDNIKDTLEYISNMVNYFTKEDNTFMDKLAHCNAAIFTINGEEKIQFTSDYKLSNYGIVINIPDVEDYVVEWHKLFKLVMDKKWEIIFIEEEKSE